MKLLRLWLPLILVAVALFFIGCDDTTDEEVPEYVNPLIGTWEMTNFYQAHVYYAGQDMAALGMLENDSISAGSLDWTGFQALGVAATVIMKDDGTFVLSGDLPAANDTLGYAPSINNLTDGGVWITPEDFSTLTIAGEIYTLGGLLTFNDDSTVISMAYAGVDTLPDAVLPVEGVGFFDMIIYDNFTTVLGFDKVVE